MEPNHSTAMVKGLSCLPSIGTHVKQAVRVRVSLAVSFLSSTLYYYFTFWVINVSTWSNKKNSLHNSMYYRPTLTRVYRGRRFSAGSSSPPSMIISSLELDVKHIGISSVWTSWFCAWIDTLITNCVANGYSDPHI